MTQRARVLELLRNAGSRGVLTGEFLNAHIPRFSARIGELNRAGHHVRGERITQGSWRYTLVEEEAADPSAHEPSVTSSPPGPALFESEPERRPLSAFTDAEAA